MIPYSRQSINFWDHLAVHRALSSDFLTQGPRVEALEDAFANYVGAKHAVAMSSGTAALHAAVWSLGLGPSSEVSTTPLTFFASVNAARYVGASVSLTDINRDTLNIEPEKVNPTADAVIAVHFAGFPVDIAAVKRVNHGFLIEDASHALGAANPEGMVGGASISDVACFSFHPVKPITAGEGGMLTTNNEDVAAAARRFRSHGIERGKNQKAWRYDVAHLGFNYRMTDLQAALGLSQLGRIEKFRAVREEQAQRYREAFQNSRLVMPSEPPDGFRHSRHLFPILVSERDKVLELLRDSGFGVQVHYVPVHHHSDSGWVRQPAGGLPETDYVAQRILSLPMHPNLTRRQQEKVIRTLQAVVDH